MYDPRWARNRILAVLRTRYPNWVRDDQLLVLLKDEQSPLSEDELRVELHYLRDWPERDDGYVELQAREKPGSREVIKSSRLTPRGLNLVERMVAADPTVAEF